MGRDFYRDIRLGYLFFYDIMFLTYFMGDVMEKEMDDNLDLLDLEDDAGIDVLPDAAPLGVVRPKKPWLLLGVGALILVLAIFVIVRVIGSDSGSSIEIDLDTPVVTVDGTAPVPVSTTTTVAPTVSQPARVTEPAAPSVNVPTSAPTHATPGVPTRVVPDRQNVMFNPDAGNVPARPAAKPAANPKPVTKPVAPAKKSAPVKKSVPSKSVAATRDTWYVQFGSYSTRALAEAAEKKIRAAHSGLFAGHQFVILAAQLPNGNTTYRLRIAFADANDANGFCRNAKSDGLDCYVAK